MLWTSNTVTELLKLLRSQTIVVGCERSLSPLTAASAVSISSPAGDHWPPGRVI
jgi:hypothetical protein